MFTTENYCGEISSLQEGIQNNPELVTDSLLEYSQLRSLCGKKSLDVSFKSKISKSDYKIKIAFPLAFRARRKMFIQPRSSSSTDVDNTYSQTLSNCLTFNAQGSKSKSFFAMSRDEHYIIKEIKADKFNGFESFATNYFIYMAGSLKNNTRSSLAKIFGIYEVFGENTNLKLVVMENVFVGQEILKKYDLKGCIFLQKNPAECTTLLDQNLVDDMVISPIVFEESAKREFEDILERDLFFLTSNRLVDYSLLIGVGLRRENGKHQLLTGTIDYLQPFTWKKKVESTFKSFRSYWNCMKGLGYEHPTVAPPDLYGARFMRSMRRYFGLNGESGPSPSQE